MAKKKAKQTIKVDWLNHLLGFFGVILGVLIAFWLNSSAQERKEAQISIIALQNIRDEIKRNIASIDSALVENKRQLAFFDAYVDRVGSDMGFLGTKKERDSLQAAYPEFLPPDGTVSINLSLYELPDVAWVTTSNTSVISSVDFELVYTLSEAYNLQKRLAELDKLLLEDLRNFRSGGKYVLLNLHQTLSTSIQLTEQLRNERYTESLEKIEAFLSGAKRYVA